MTIDQKHFSFFLPKLEKYQSIYDVKGYASYDNCYIFEPVTINFTCKTAIALKAIKAQIYVKHPGHASRIEKRELILDSNNIFVTTIIPDCIGTITYYAKLSINGKQYTSETYKITVAPQKPEPWINGPIYKQVDKHLWVGNSQAAYRGTELGFDCILNLIEHGNFAFPSNQYKFIPLRDWGNNPIADESIIEAIDWLNFQIEKERKILINCRAGIGRSGSVAVAYIFAKNKQLNYHQAVHIARHGDDNMIEGKENIYPHMQLKESLEALYPDSLRPSSTKIKSIEFEDYAINKRINLKANKKLLVRAHLSFEGPVEPFVFLHCNTNENKAPQDIRMTKICDTHYQAELSSIPPGEYWLTLRASNYLSVNPWYDPETWAGGNIDIIVKA
ncbi:MAG TPA: hypothetical protein DF296_03640 [Candidatus Margulisbacteria bacterium]|nr:MAG: hypothetical protein A2X43_02980 [Candidatus Margulisbacteria bacterium GWD2_39_127]OGI09838.1 MAG: hypothetical protein A2X41_09925 [Candidatus Margulisbacteria bacterium GWE2_39_32]HAR64161.1 hypothetical protein [Candidatus Margulisiibacteriota bacterium]HCT84274.1 hypothetical protein [Candidatus Margulisiibacteriota bacterium]